MTDDQPRESDPRSRLSWPGETAPPAWTTESSRAGESPSEAAPLPGDPEPALEVLARMDNADLVELFRLQKQVRLELHEVGESVNRLAARSGESDAELKQAMKLAMARNDTAQLADAVTRLTTQSAQTSTVLAEVLRALAAQAKTTKDDFESFLALVDEVKDEMHSLRDRFEHQSDERGGSATPEPDEPDAGTPSK